MKTIMLSAGRICIVDDEDYDWLNAFKWSFDLRYAVRRIMRQRVVTSIYMHRLIIGAAPGEHVDHVNRDKLDNRRSNLRICTPTKNNANIPIKRNNKSGFKGVFWLKKCRKWQANITLNGRGIYLGLFDTPVEAAMKYDSEATKLFGEFALTNEHMGLIAKVKPEQLQL